MNMSPWTGEISSQKIIVPRTCSKPKIKITWGPQSIMFINIFRRIEIQRNDRLSAAQ